MDHDQTKRMVIKSAKDVKDLQSQIKKNQETFEIEKKIRDENHSLKIKELESKHKQLQKEMSDLVAKSDKANLEI